MTRIEPALEPRWSDDSNDPWETELLARDADGEKSSSGSGEKSRLSGKVKPRDGFVVVADAMQPGLDDRLVQRIGVPEILVLDERPTLLDRPDRNERERRLVRPSLECGIGDELNVMSATAEPASDGDERKRVADGPYGGNHDTGRPDSPRQRL